MPCSPNKSIQKVYAIVRMKGTLVNSVWKQFLKVTLSKFNLLLKVSAIKSSDQVAQMFT